MGKVKYFNQTTQKWEYAETGGTPKRGVDYWLQQDQQPIYDYISKKVVDATGQCRLTISLGSNQLDKSVLEGLAMSVTLPNGNVVTKYSGNTTSFTTGSVTVVFPNVAGYKKPDNFIFSYKKGFVSKKFNYLGEVVTVNPLCDGVATNYAYTVTAENAVALTDGASLDAEVNGVTQWLVPHGVTMTVTPSSVSGYNSSIMEYIPSSVEGSLNIEWTPIPNGIYIADAAGNLWEVDSWDNTSTAVGVAVITNNSSYIIGRVSTYKSYIAWSGNTSTDLSDVPTSTVRSTIVTYYDGVSYTDAMIAAGPAYNTTLYAAGYVRSQSISFGSSTLTGYLGSAGEWQDVLNNRETIMNAFSTIGDTFVSSDSYADFWTSCEYSSSKAWSVFWDEFNEEWAVRIDTKSAFSSLYAVPFYKL